MRITIRSHGANSQLQDVHVDGAEVIADLLEAAVAPGVPLYVNGEPVTPEMPTDECGVNDGAILDIGGSGRQSTICVVELHGVVGHTAGEILGLKPGRYRVGDHGDIDIPGTSSRLDVSPEGEVFLDEAQHLQGLLTLGDTGWLVKQPRRIALRTAGAHLRPPRTRVVAESPRVHPPALDKPAERSTRFRWVMLIGPIVMGGAMALLFSPRMAWMAALSPILMLGNWIDAKSQSKRARKSFAKNVLKAESQFRADLDRSLEMTRLRHLAERTTVEVFVVVALSDDARLWQRRADHSDAFHVVLGYGRESWDIPLSGPVPPELEPVLAEYAHTGLGVLPTMTMLDRGSALGIAGPSTSTAALARSVLVQLAAAHGPADLRIGVITDKPKLWDWAKWLPHTQSLSGEWMIGSDSDIGRVLAEVAVQARQTHVVLLVDREMSPDLVNGLRDVSADVALVIMTSQQRGLPSLCDATFEFVGSAATGRWRPHHESSETLVSFAGTPVSVAGRLARVLAGVSDPEVEAEGGSLPDGVSLVDVLAPHGGRLSQTDVIEAWAQCGNSIIAPIGISESGRFDVDLVHDGPHALLAGTTGAGKSELLRTLVASLAFSVHPEKLNFVLIDYKGGSAFDVCSRLPHVVGMVTDLDSHLGERAKVSLEAELHHREIVLREAGASDIVQYQSMGLAPLPRLFIVVDEFAAMTSDLPDFVAALVDIAQRGRSLGVHVLLATQRPAGIVKENIRANTNLRLSLRVQSDADSKDVIDTDAAARLPRNRPGRALARRGHGDVVSFQTALVSGHSGRATSRSIRPFVFGPDQPRPVVEQADAHGPSDLEILVRLICDVATELGIGSQRQPWLDPLPAEIGPDAIDSAHTSEEIAVVLGLADHPEEQSQPAFGWKPADGNVLAYGGTGSGVSDVISVFAISAARSFRPDELHMYVLDFGRRGFGELDVLPHVGAVITADDLERQKRVMNRLAADLERRRRGASGPHVILAIDNLPALLTALDSGPGWAYRDLVTRLMADGPELGIFVLATAQQATGVPMKLAGLVATKYVFALPDPLDIGNFGLRGADVPELISRRAIDVASRAIFQLARLAPDSGVVDRGSGDGRPEPVEVLSSLVKVGEISNGCGGAGDRFRFPIGMAGESLKAAAWELYEDDHVFVGGGLRTGRSTTLVSMAHIAYESPDDVLLFGVALRRSPLRDVPFLDRLITTEDELADFLENLAADDSYRRTFVFVDDAQSVDDPGGRLETFIAARRPNLHFVTAVRTDDGLAGYSHWSRAVRKSRVGVLLDPEPQHGDLLGTTIAKGVAEGLAGRGVLVANGRTTLVQVAHP